MTTQRSKAEATLKELEANKLKVWPAQNINPHNQICGLKADGGYGFVSKVDLASHGKSWLREVTVKNFDQSTYIEGTDPVKTKKAKALEVDSESA